MAKQKIVVKVTMNNHKKARKAIKIVVSIRGVESASFVGSDKDQIEVTGEGIDSVELAKLLRKGLGCTTIVSVGPVAEETLAATTTAACETQATVVPWHVYPPYYNSGVVRYEAHYNDDPSCSIM